MFGEELPQRLGMGAFEFGQGGPAAEQVQHEITVQRLAEQRDDQREVQFEDAAQPQCDALAFIDEASPELGQVRQAAGLGRVRLPDAELVSMMLQEAGQQFGIARIVLAAGGIHGFAVAGELFGIDRVQPQSLEGEQGVDQGSAALFEGDGQRVAGEPLLQLVNPVGDVVRILIERATGGAAAGFDQTDDMLSIGPVDADDHRRGVGWSDPWSGRRNSRWSSRWNSRWNRRWQ